MYFLKDFIESLNFGNRNDKIHLAEQIERDFNNSYSTFVDHYLSNQIGLLGLPSSFKEDLRNDFEFNTWFLNNFIKPLFSYGWVIGYMNKYKNRFYQLNAVINDFNAEAKEHLLHCANEILNYYRNKEIAYIYTTCGNNMFHEGKDAGVNYNGPVEITRL